MTTQSNQPSIQNIRQSIDTLIKEFSLMKQSTPSVKVKKSVGKALVELEAVDTYAEKAFSLFEENGNSGGEHQQHQGGKYQPRARNWELQHS